MKQFSEFLKSLIVIAGLFVAMSETAFSQSQIHELDGKVGIGTISPQFKLDVGTALYETYFNMGHFHGSPWGLYMGTSNEGAPFKLNAYNIGYFGQINVGIDNADDVSLVLNHTGHQGGTDYFRNTIIANGKKSPIAIFNGSTGNVGIGKINPEAKLTVVRTGGEEPVRIDTIPGNKGNVYLTFAREGKRKWFLQNTTDDNSFRVFQEGNPRQNELVILENSNVGIGTINPEAKLTVVRTGGEEPVRIDTIPGSKGNVYLTFAREGNRKWFLQNTTADNSFRVFQEGNLSENEFVILENGNVGIGTKTPNAKLSVKGKVVAEEIEVTTVAAKGMVVRDVAWADYVFDKDYKLLPLNEVEQFIKKNKHLPNIPSEKEVEEQGVELGEMQAKLLSKVEELTLHLIEQNKLLMEQNRKIAKLEKELERIRE